MDAVSKNIVTLLTGLVIFGAISTHIHLNETVATGVFIGTLLAGSRFLKTSRLVKEHEDAHCAIGYE